MSCSAHSVSVAADARAGPRAESPIKRLALYFEVYTDRVRARRRRFSLALYRAAGRGGEGVALLEIGVGMHPA